MGANQTLHRRHRPADAAAGRSDQADGLRRLFIGSGTCFLPVVGNPHVTLSGVAIERLSAALSMLGKRTLIVDAAEGAPMVSEAFAFGIASCVEHLTPKVSYLAARGLPARFVDTHGSSARLLDVLATAAPNCEVVVVHGEAAEIARLFTGRSARPVLLAADGPHSVKHAYAAWKFLAQRRGWLSADLLLLASANSPRVQHIATSFARCADEFMGAVLAAWALVDPGSTPHEMPDEDLHRIAATQLMLHEGLAHPLTAAQQPAAIACTAAIASH